MIDRLNINITNIHNNFLFILQVKRKRFLLYFFSKSIFLKTIKWFKKYIFKKYILNDIHMPIMFN